MRGGESQWAEGIPHAPCKQVGLRVVLVTGVGMGGPWLLCQAPGKAELREVS